MSLKVPLYFVLLNNSIPIVGLLFFDLQIFDILFYYLIELIAIGFSNAVKILLSRKGEKLPFKYNDASNHLLTSQTQVKVSALGIFLLWYGIYVGVFLLILYKVVGLPVNSTLSLVVLVPFVNHAILLISGYLMKRRYLITTPFKQITEPIIKTVPTITILIIASFFGQYSLLIVFLIIKTISDYYLYSKREM